MTIKPSNTGRTTEIYMKKLLSFSVSKELNTVKWVGKWSAHNKCKKITLFVKVNTMNSCRDARVTNVFVQGKRMKCEYVKS